MKEYVNRIPDERTATVYMQMLQALSIEKLYLDAGLTATKLAERLKIDKRVISAVVQRETGNNYTHLVNSMRLREACKMLKSPRYVELTAEQIGLLCGFKSRQSFYTAFRRMYNETPNGYRNRK